ncbi:MAG: aminopeptidase P family protein [Deltaproteobacteria bacterium]|nr:aminopeptidase P family protein [Deltaproteobacteria bacterium]
MELTEFEKNRRYDLIREKMAEEDLSALLVVSDAQIERQGFVRYFTNLPIPIFTHALLFPLSGEPFLLTPSPLQTYWAKQMAWIPEENITLSKEFGRDLGKKLNALKLADKRVGLITFKTLSAKDLEELRGQCGDLSLIDSTMVMENVRSVKGAEEIVLVKQATHIADTAQRTFFDLMRPGISEMELVAKVEESIRCRGGERSFYLILSDARFVFPYVPGEHKIGRESPVIFSVEVSGPCGYWSQIVRTYFWEKPKGSYARLYKALCELRLLAQTELRPGKRVKEIAAALRESILGHGFEYGVHFGHGLGLDVVEEPLIHTENERVIEKNQFVTIHPHLIDQEESKGVWLGDMYFIGEDETEILSPLPGETKG